MNSEDQFKSHQTPAYSAALQGIPFPLDTDITISYITIMDDTVLSFMTPRHHAVRNFVVRELPRNHGRPLTPSQIARSLHLDIAATNALLDDLERHLFFLVRDTHGSVNWAFPVTSDRTPHRLRFSSGESIYGA